MKTVELSEADIRALRSCCLWMAQAVEAADGSQPPDTEEGRDLFGFLFGFVGRTGVWVDGIQQGGGQ